jgi:hypothetical protein
MLRGRLNPGEFPVIEEEYNGIKPYPMYDVDNYRWDYTESWMLASGTALVEAASPMWNYTGAYIKQVAYGEVVSSSSTAVTMLAGDAANFIAGDVVWLMDISGNQKEYLGAVTLVSGNVVTVTTAPINTGAGILYVAKANHATATSSAAAAIVFSSNGQTGDVGSIWYGITVTATHENGFSLGDFVYETATNGTGIKSLGYVAHIDYANHIIYVTIAPAVTGGGKLYAGGQEVDIVGLLFWDAKGETMNATAANVGVNTLIDGIVYKSRLGKYGGSTSKADIWVQKKLKTDLPRIHITTHEVVGI